MGDEVLPVGASVVVVVIVAVAVSGAPVGMAVTGAKRGCVVVVVVASTGSFATGTADIGNVVGLAVVGEFVAGALDGSSVDRCAKVDGGTVGLIVTMMELVGTLVSLANVCWDDKTRCMVSLDSVGELVGGGLVDTVVGGGTVGLLVVE